MHSLSQLRSDTSHSPESRRHQQTTANRTSRLRQQRETLGIALELLRSRAENVSIPAGETIFFEEDDAANVYIIKCGVVRLCMTTLQCGKMISDFMFPNDPLGSVGQSSYMCTAEAASDVDLFRLSRAEADDLLGQAGNKDVLSSHAWQLAADAWRFQKVMGEQTPDQRLACFLVKVSQRTQTPVGRPMNLQISHADIACYLGLSADELSGSFDALAGQHAINASVAGTCTIMDPTAVIELALRAVLPNGAPKWQRASPDMNSILA